MPVSSYNSLLKKLLGRKVKLVVIGVSGINYYADDPGNMFSTQDLDLLVQPTGENLRAVLRLLEREGFRLEANGEPVVGLDLWLARKLLEHRAVITARKGRLRVDIVTSAGGIPFPEWNSRRRVFRIGRVPVPVGGLLDLLRAKENCNREKDRRFLALYKIQLKEMLKKAGE